MRKKIEWSWEKLDDSTQRAKVIGGWIILHSQINTKGISSESMVFVQDRDHEYHILVRQPEKVKPDFAEVEPAY